MTLIAPEVVSNIRAISDKLFGKVNSKNGANIRAIARPSQDRCAVKEELLLIQPYNLLFLKNMIKSNGEFLFLSYYGDSNCMLGFGSILL